MYFDRFSKSAQKSIDASIECAKEFGHRVVGTEHLLMGLIKEKDSIASRVLLKSGMSEDIVYENIIDAYGVGINDSVDDIFLSPITKDVLDKSFIFANKFGRNLVDTEHILLSILQETDSLAVEILSTNNITDEIIIKFLKDISGVDTNTTFLKDSIEYK